MAKANIGNKSICLPVLSEAAYKTLISNPTRFRNYLNLWLAKHPEIFPAEMVTGFWFHDIITSRKLNLKMRRIQLLETGEVYQLRPEFAMPYMVSRTDEVEKGLFLRRYGVSWRFLWRAGDTPILALSASVPRFDWILCRATFGVAWWRYELK